MFFPYIFYKLVFWVFLLTEEINLLKIYTCLLTSWKTFAYTLSCCILILKEWGICLRQMEFCRDYYVFQCFLPWWRVPALSALSEAEWESQRRTHSRNRVCPQGLWTAVAPLCCLNQTVCVFLLLQDTPMKKLSLFILYIVGSSGLRFIL